MLIFIALVSEYSSDGLFSSLLKGFVVHVHINQMGRVAGGLLSAGRFIDSMVELRYSLHCSLVPLKIVTLGDRRTVLTRRSEKYRTVLIS